MPFCCPVCGGLLTLESGSFYCSERHCFDRAKSGYVNLLPSHMAHSKDPGDNRRMVETRFAFLEKGYYISLQEAVCCRASQAAEICQSDTFTLLDAGCGEGYYTAAMADALQNTGRSFEVLGVDISKRAVNLAARRTKKVSFAVASVFHLPVENNSCQMVSVLFAPFCRNEYYRVLNNKGILLWVIPGRDHLWELKEAVYKKPYPNEVKPYEIEGFQLISRDEVRQQIQLNNREDIQNLFEMTPYSYKTSREDAERLYRLENLETTISFEILCYRVNK